MMSDWEKTKTSKICSFQNGFAFKSSVFSNSGYRVIRIKELKDGGIRFFDDSAYVDVELDDFKTYQVQQGDILFALTGDPVSRNNPLSWVGRVSKYRGNEICLINQRVCMAFPDEKFIIKDFLYYYFRVFDNFYTLSAKATGSASQANISTKTIGDTDIRLPSIMEQHVIAAILSRLDDKIELNNHINANLEAQAQAIFKSWFVDFEPWDGVMPEDWQTGSLLDIADYLNGLAMQRFRPADGKVGLPVLKIKELRQGVCDSSGELCSPGIRPDYIVRDGDVIFSWSGSLLVDFWCGGDCGLNQHLFKVTSKNYDKWFYYIWTCYHLDQFIAMAADKATTMGHIKREALANAEVLIPSAKDYTILGEILAPLYDQVINNRLESRKLALLRDTLLPRLMSGELAVDYIAGTK